MNYRDDYPLSVWLDDVAEIIKRRDFVGKKEALQLIVNHIEDFLEMYQEGLLPQAVYKELVD